MDDDELSEEADALWCADQREIVIEYLARQGLPATRVSDWPAWHIAPVLAVWAVESCDHPGWVGWWAISGDVPTDYAPCRAERNPRQALHDIGQKWIEAANRWAIGMPHDDMRMDSQETERELAHMLQARAKMLLEWASDHSLWEE